MPELAVPSFVALAETPTPLVRMARTSAHLGVDFWIKRDDLTGCELSGNKVRKLEFLLADALDQRADTLISCGGAQSNHCRAVAMTAARLGLGCHLFLRADDPDNPPPITGNILLDRMAGAEIRWISRAQYANRDELMAGFADSLRGDGGRPYVIPEGGSNSVGAWGYLRCASELADSLADLPAGPTTLVYACGSGGTGAGLVLGKALGVLPRDLRLVAVNVCDDEDYFVATIGRICRDFDQRYGTAAEVTRDDIEILDGFVGDGYAKSRPEELQAQVALCRREGVVLDPVYTGKAYFAIERTLARDPAAFGERVVFLHTGGIFGMFGGAGGYASVL